jgi:predicted O-methyltransferase YrrM
MDQSSPPFTPAAPKREAAADQLQALGAALEQAGYSEAAQLAFQAAANLDLADAELQRSWGGPMNGQRGRAEAFLALITAIEASAIVETGTYRGTTTEWMAANFHDPIYTCEIDPRMYYQAREKLGGYSNVTCVLQDSREFLRAVLPKLERERAVLFYLDAHWQEDLPLQEELALIFKNHPRAVIMIDDFAVPHDSGYAWDDYGPGKQLTLELLSASEGRDARIFFPSLPSQAETGAKRGCCVLTKDEDLAAKIAALTAFRGADWREWRLVELATQVDRVELESARLRQTLSQAEAALHAAAQEQARQKGAFDAALSEAHEQARVELQRAMVQLAEEAALRAEQQEGEKAELARLLSEARDELVRARQSHDAETARLSAALAEAGEAATRERQAHTHTRDTQAQRQAELEQAIAAAIGERENLRAEALAELQARERALEQRDAKLRELETRLEGESAARVQLADQLRIMKAYSGIIE